MSVKRLLAALAVFLILLALTACTLSASTPPPTTPTTDSAMSTLEAELGNIATQTAAAGGSGDNGSGTVATPGQPSSPGGTPEGGGPTQPPQPDATQAPQPEQPEQPDQEEPDDVPEWEPTPGLPKTYTLQKYEFPFCIARRFNLNQSELLNLNGLGLNSVVSVGFVLTIPQTGNHFVGTRALQKHPTTYTVVAGDTIYSIACKFGSVDPNGIIAVNKLKSPYNLSAGQKLAIP